MKNRAGILYRLTFDDGKSYIGITCQGLEKRLRAHLSSSRRTPVRLAIKRYGRPRHETLVIANIGYLLDLEIAAIKAFGTRIPNGYNVSFGGESPPAPETVARISRSLTGRTFTTEHRASLSRSMRCLGERHPMRTPTARSRMAIIAATLAFKPGVAEKKAAFMRGDNNVAKRPEVRAKISAAMAGKKCALGLKRTAETRKKMSEAALRREAKKRSGQ